MKGAREMSPPLGGSERESEISKKTSRVVERGRGGGGGRAREPYL